MDKSGNDRLINKITKIAIGLILLIFVLFNFETFRLGLSSIFDTLSPFMLGGMIALFINVILVSVENSLNKVFKNEEEGKYRGLSVLLTFIIITLVLVFVFYTVIPKLSEIVTSLVRNLPSLVQRVTDWLEARSNDAQLASSFEMMRNRIYQGIDELAQWLNNSIGEIAGLVVNYLNTIISNIANFIISLIFAVYLLFYKEKLSLQLKKVIRAFLSEDPAEVVIFSFKRFDRLFKNFFAGQMIEALIFFALCFVTMSILRLPYAFPISILQGFASLIPYFGAFIGAGISILLISTIDIYQALIFLVMIVIIQQVESNAIYPKVMGSKIGLPSIWVMASVALAGFVAGIPAMIFAVPITTFLYETLRDLVEFRNRKDYPINDEDTSGLMLYVVMIENKEVKDKENMVERIESKEKTELIKAKIKSFFNK